MDYVCPETAVPASQLLQVAVADKVYRFGILHATLDERPAPGRGRRPTEHAHDSAHLIIFRRGENEFWWQGRPWPAKRGTLVLASPGEPHAFGCARGEAADYGELTFQLVAADGEQLRWPFGRLLAAYAGIERLEFSGYQQLEENQTQRLLGSLETLLAELVGGGRPLRLAGLVGGLLAEVLEAVGNEAPAAAEEVGLPLALARSELARRFREDFSLGELARKVGWSESYLCRAFRREFGLAPLEYRRRLRVRAAENLLANTDLRGKEIAQRVGFGDEYRFSKVFKLENGLSPRAWREQARGGGG